MSSVTSVSNPSLFSTAPPIPYTGFHYILQTTENSYTYGQKLSIYQMGVVREQDSATILGTEFYPYNGYPDIPSMIATECQNVLNLFLEFYAQDLLTADAKTAIGF